MIPERQKVDQVIAEIVLREAYEVISELLTCASLGDYPDKKLMLRARKLLPAQYTHSLQKDKK